MLHGAIVARLNTLCKEQNSTKDHPIFGHWLGVQDRTMRHGSPIRERSLDGRLKFRIREVNQLKAGSGLSIAGLLAPLLCSKSLEVPVVILWPDDFVSLALESLHDKRRRQQSLPLQVCLRHID